MGRAAQKGFSNTGSAAVPLPAGGLKQAGSASRWLDVAVDAVRAQLVDDQAAYLRAMSSVVEETPGFAVVGEASSGEECVFVAAQVVPTSC